ncbi:pyruvoyl-dependent arginine decarboxylase [Halovenus sp. WSH3]|uniref:arginine decarboxylase n=1 Tax=Halovenus carboxidivorans TaxID=2692199 RepID=A0A6B0TCT8_9EURY|nr:pyruvoyl-dependent arginine decarboxylase [Halovenus carboxidivorans]MXR52730.1 pyruvoyl-dependent arginine decarboxylase [Halovenus carboxidivorans]
MIRLVWGTGHAATGKASFDAALADAGLHQYNLRTLSSVIPAGASLELAETAPDLGPTGNALDVVLARQTSPPGARAAAGLAWVRGEDGAGIFYEAADTDPETVGELLRVGIERGCYIRDLDYGGVETKIVTADSAPDEYTTAVVVAAYGDSEPLL